MTTVLVVDDEPDVRFLLKLQLEGSGFDVVGESPDGRDGVAACSRLHPDAVVLDLNMPVMNGYEAIPALREVDPDVAIVVYSATGAGEAAHGVLDHFGVPLVVKSGDVSPLVAALHHATVDLRD